MCRWVGGDGLGKKKRKKRRLKLEIFSENRIILNNLETMFSILASKVPRVAPIFKLGPILRNIFFHILPYGDEHAISQIFLFYGDRLTMMFRYFR